MFTVMVTGTFTKAVSERLKAVSGKNVVKVNGGGWIKIKIKIKIKIRIKMKGRGGDGSVRGRRWRGGQAEA